MSRNLSSTTDPSSLGSLKCALTVAAARCSTKTMISNEPITGLFQPSIWSQAPVQPQPMVLGKAVPAEVFDVMSVGACQGSVLLSTCTGPPIGLSRTVGCETEHPSLASSLGLARA